jgi:hypothetical protein
VRPNATPWSADEGIGSTSGVPELTTLLYRPSRQPWATNGPPQTVNGGTFTNFLFGYSGDPQCRGILVPDFTLYHHGSAAQPGQR